MPSFERDCFLTKPRVGSRIEGWPIRLNPHPDWSKRLPWCCMVFWFLSGCQKRSRPRSWSRKVSQLCFSSAHGLQPPSAAFHFDITYFPADTYASSATHSILTYSKHYYISYLVTIVLPMSTLSAEVEVVEAGMALVSTWIAETILLIAALSIWEKCGFSKAAMTTRPRCFYSFFHLYLLPMVA